MQKYIVYKQQNGRAALIVPAEGYPLETIIKKDVPSGAEYAVVSVDDLPKEDYFFNAWRLEGKKIVVDIPECKDIAHKIRRDVRASEMAPYDIQVTIPGKAEAAEAERETLRRKYAGIQAEIDAAQTPKEVAAVIDAMIGAAQ